MIHQPVRKKVITLSVDELEEDAENYSGSNSDIPEREVDRVQVIVQVVPSLLLSFV